MGCEPVPQMWADTEHPSADGWRVRVHLELRNGEVVATGYEVTSQTGEPIRKAPVLHRMGLGLVGERIVGDIKLGAQVGNAFAGWVDSFLAFPRVGRARRPDRPYAVWAQRYVEAQEADPRRPLAWLVDRYGVEAGGTETEAGIRAKLTQARRRGLLTSAPSGRAGGELTDKARRLLGLNEED